MNGYLSYATKTLVVEGAAAAGTSTLTTDAVDMTGFNAARFIWFLGDVTSGSVITATVLTESDGNASGGTSAAAGTEITAGASDYDSTLLIVDVLRPADRYVYSTLARGTQNAVVNGCICELYNARSLPVTQHASAMQLTVAVQGGDS